MKSPWNILGWIAVCILAEWFAISNVALTEAVLHGFNNW